MTKKLTLPEILLLVLMLIVAAACVRLGIWQIDRLNQRLDRNAQIEARLSQPVVAFPPRLALDDQTYQRVSVVGRFDPGHAVLLENRPLNDQAGYHLLVPFQVNGSGEVVLVDRGWIPFDQALDTDPTQLAAAATADTSVEGVLLPSQPEPLFKFLADQIPGPGEAPLLSWRVVDLAGIQAQLPYSLYPLYLAQTAPAAENDSWPIPVFEPDLSNGPHLSYAIQWFAFAAIALVGGTALLHRHYRKRTADHQEVRS